MLKHEGASNNVVRDYKPQYNIFSYIQKHMQCDLPKWCKNTKYASICRETEPKSAKRICILTNIHGTLDHTFLGFPDDTVYFVEF